MQAGKDKGANSPRGEYLPSWEFSSGAYHDVNDKCAGSSPKSCPPETSLNHSRFWPTQSGCDLGKATGKSDRLSPAPSGLNTPYPQPPPQPTPSGWTGKSLGQGRRKSRQPSPPECSVLSRLCGANPWPPAPLSGPWILEGAGHTSSPRISGLVPSWSQARTEPGSFSRLTPTPPTCFRPLSPPLPTVSTTQKEASGEVGREAAELGNSRPQTAS